MRITQKMISRNLLTTLTKNRSRAAELQMDIATARKVRRPSDDPAAMMQIERINRLISKNDQYSRNIGQVSGFVSASMNALDSISEQLDEARRIAIQGASGTSSPDARASLANVIDQIAESVLEMANTEWRWEMTITATDDPSLRRLDVEVFHADDKKDRVKARMTGFIARI